MTCECGREGIHLCHLRIKESTPEEREERLTALKSASEALTKLRDEHGVDFTDYSHWSTKLPPCSKCGCIGLHACTGKPIPPMTEEQQARLREALRGIFDAEQGLEKPE